MKKIISVLMVGALTMSGLVGCGNKVEDTKQEETKQEDTKQEEGSSRIAEKDVAIDFWHHMEGVNAEAVEGVCNKFNDTLGKEYGIVVTPSFQGTDTAEKLKTLAQASDWNNFPNVCQIASAGIPTVSQYDSLIKPEDMYAKGENIILSRESIILNNARTFTYEDQLCALPFSNSTILLYYNKDMFEEAGLDPINPPKTIAELADASSKLMVKTGDEVSTYGLNVAVKRYQLTNWIGGQGEYNFIGDNEGGRKDLMTKFTFGEDGSLMNFLNKWEKVIKTGGYKPIEDNINEEFAMELTGMAIMSSARIGKVETLVGDNFEWGTAPLPKVNASDKGGTAVGGSGVVMFDKQDQDKATASWIFLQYLGGEEAQYDFCTASGYIPMNKDLYETDKMKEYLASNDKVVAAVEQLLSSNPNVQEPFDMVTNEINIIIDEEMAAFGEGTQDKQTTHDNIVNKCNEKIDKYVKVNAQ